MPDDQKPQPYTMLEILDFLNDNDGPIATDPDVARLSETLRVREEESIGLLMRYYDYENTVEILANMLGCKDEDCTCTDYRRCVFARAKAVVVERKERSDELMRLTQERDRYKEALERILSDPTIIRCAGWSTSYGDAVRAIIRYALTSPTP